MNVMIQVQVASNIKSEHTRTRWESALLPFVTCVLLGSITFYLILTFHPHHHWFSSHLNLEIPLPITWCKWWHQSVPLIKVRFVILPMCFIGSSLLQKCSLKCPIASMSSSKSLSLDSIWWYPFHGSSEFMIKRWDFHITQHFTHSIQIIIQHPLLQGESDEKQLIF